MRVGDYPGATIDIFPERFVSSDDYVDQDLPVGSTVTMSKYDNKYTDCIQPKLVDAGIEICMFNKKISRVCEAFQLIRQRSIPIGEGAYGGPANFLAKSQANLFICNLTCMYILTDPSGIIVLAKIRARLCFPVKSYPTPTTG